MQASRGEPDPEGAAGGCGKRGAIGDGLRRKIADPKLQ